MTKTKTAAQIAAANYIYITRKSPGGNKTQAGRLRYDAEDRAADLMAAKLGPNASSEERRDFLIQLEEAEDGARLFLPVPAGGIDLRQLTPAEKLAWVHGEQLPPSTGRGRVR